MDNPILDGGTALLGIAGLVYAFFQWRQTRRRWFLAIGGYSGSFGLKGAYELFAGDSYALELGILLMMFVGVALLFWWRPDGPRDTK